MPPAAEKRFGEEVLLDYVTGALDGATALMVAAQASLCPQTRETITLMEAVGGALIETTEPVAMTDGALERLFAQVDAGSVAEPASDDGELAALPAPVRDRIAAHGGKWSFLAPGVRSMDIGFDAPRGEGARAPGEVKLYRIEPGKGVPTHTHEGNEVTLVLTGAFSDGQGRYGPGDIALADPEVTHRPVAEPGEVCFALAITDAPLQLTGALGLVQRALRGGA